LFSKWNADPTDHTDQTDLFLIAIVRLRLCLSRDIYEAQPHLISKTEAHPRLNKNKRYHKGCNCLFHQSTERPITGLSIPILKLCWLNIPCRKQSQFITTNILKNHLL